MYFLVLPYPLII